MFASRSFFELVGRDFFVDFEDDFARLLVDDVVRRDLAHELLGIGREAIDLGFLQLLHRRLGVLGVLLDDDFRADLDVTDRALAREELVLDGLGVLAALFEVHRLGVVEVVEEVLRRCNRGHGGGRSRASSGGGRCGQ